MARSDIRHIIESAGLEKEEAQLYVVGLEIGSAPASAYGKHAKFNRVTTYNYLERLSKNGFFTTVKRGRTKWYAPVDPEYLALEARKSAEALERALPELRALRGSHHRKPIVRFFEGHDGMRRVYEDTLSAEGEILNFANSAIVRHCWQEYDTEYVAERVKRGIHLRGIAPDDSAGRRVHGHDKENIREIRLVSAKQFNFNNEINMYDNKVAITSFEENGNVFGIIIESKEVADTQKQIFEMAWLYAAGKNTKDKN